MTLTKMVPYKNGATCEEMRRGYLPRAELIEFQKTINIFAALHKKGSFPLRISLVNVTKSSVSSGFGHIY